MARIHSNNIVRLFERSVARGQDARFEPQVDQTARLGNRARWVVPIELRWICIVPTGIDRYGNYVGFVSRIQ